LSYATLANLPVINGIYTAILPGMAYVIFGTSMHLGLGPVALVSILTGQLVIQYGIDYVKDPQEAVDFAGECALAVGTIFAVLSVLNLGDMINLISHPVMVSMVVLIRLPAPNLIFFIFAYSLDSLPQLHATLA